jgi:hypothetical protein
MTADIGQDAVVDENPPELDRVVGGEYVLAGAAEPVDRVRGMVADDELVSSVGVPAQRFPTPRPDQTVLTKTMTRSPSRTAYDSPFWSAGPFRGR